MTPPYQIRVVDRFDKERYLAMRSDLLVGQTSYIQAHTAFGEDIGKVNERPNALRVGAFDATERLIGFSFGWQQGEGCFYMAISAVDTEHQRRGVYSAILDCVAEEARARGYAELWSRHLPDNAPILIAKLKRGFVITGVEMTAVYGMMVTMALPLNEARAAALAFRMGSRRMPQALAPWFLGNDS